MGTGDRVHKRGLVDPALAAVRASRVFKVGDVVRYSDQFLAALHCAFNDPLRAQRGEIAALKHPHIDMWVGVEWDDTDDSVWIDRASIQKE